MSELRAAAEMALEALENMAEYSPSRLEHQIISLRTALAQPEQEPVAWIESLGKPQPRCVTNLKYRSVAEVDAGVQFIPLYTAPPKRAPDQPDDMAQYEQKVNVAEERVQKLADIENDRITLKDDADMKISKVIEAKLKERNT